MAVRDPTANCQSNPRSFIFFAPVQPLKYGENPLGILFLEANPVILNCQLTIFFGFYSISLGRAF